MRDGVQSLTAQHHALTGQQLGGYLKAAPIGPVGLAYPEHSELIIAVVGIGNHLVREQIGVHASGDAGGDRVALPFFEQLPRTVE